MGAYFMWDQGNSTLFFDVVKQETHEKSSTITEHPVEVGADVTDHVRPNLDHLTLETFISNTPVWSDAGQQSAVPLQTPDPPTPLTINGAINVIGALINPKNQLVANVFTFDGPPDFVAQTLSTLEELRTKAQLITVVCPQRIYDNMLIESVEMTRGPDDGTGATFSIELREIRVVISSVVSAPTPTIPRGQPKQNKGAQAPVDAAAQKKSVITALVNGISKGGSFF